MTRGTQREVKGTLAKNVLSYVRRALGPDAVEQVFELAGRRMARDGLSQPASWTTTADTIAIAEAAVVVCGDADIGRRAGEELMRLQRERGTIDFVRAAGSIEDALVMAANAGTKMSTGRTLEVTESGPGYAVLTGAYVDQADAHPFFCGHTAGYFALVPDVFGATGVITEPVCVGRGDDRCVYRVTWREIAADAALPAVAASRERMESFVSRFEQLHVMATELAGAEGLDGLLDRITERAGVAVDASRFVLAVHAGDSDDVIVHQRGFDGQESAERFAQRLLAADVIEEDRLLVAEVVSANRSYGRLAALYPRGSSVTEMERRLLRAYARHAAAALDAVASLESARRDRDSAEALLSLAHALAEVGASSEVATRLAAAVPAVAGCTKSGVWMWDQDTQTLSLAAAFVTGEDRQLRNVPSILHASQIPSLGDLVHRPVPLLLDRGDVDGVLRRIMDVEDLLHCAVVPIEARGQFLGVVTAGFCGAVPPAIAGDLLHRLQGLADQAASALDNAALLEAVRQQALHDALTGLPNRTLLADRAGSALARGRRTGHTTSLLFVDLDRFKDVNDTFGHEMGDELIRQTADRLVDCVRGSDTIARFGGDEFIALLPDTPPEGAVSVAASIVRALNRPFDLAGHEVFVSASVGAATAPNDAEDYPGLLGRADAAMYAAKQDGGARFSSRAIGGRVSSAVASAP